MKTKIVIFGITGDLSTRKLLPALDAIVKTAEVNDLSIVGVSRRDVDINELLQDQPGLIDRTAIFTMDLAASDDYVRLHHYLELDSDTQALIYLSVPPSAAADIVDFLGVAGINTSNVKILFEKPFGFDLESAREVIDRTARYFSETQLYRIDHYMAKDVAQEVIRLRSNAENHHHGWGENTITSIVIVASEKIGVEGRGVFYEQTGALRDVIQGHLMQLLSLVLMDIPADFSLDNLPHYRKQALDYVRLLSLEGVRRSQYRGYQQEVTNIGSQTETFTAITLTSEHSRWKDVTLSLVTGKNLADKRTYISVNYLDGTTDIFEEKSHHPDDRLPDAYERVLVEAIQGRKAIFTTSSEVLRSWEILAPIQQAWAMDNHPLVQYEPGIRFDDDPLYVG